MSTTPEVLFVCVHNAGRSQMAAALLAHHAAGRVHVRSAGSIPADEILNLTQASNQVAERIRQRTGDYLSAEQRLLTRLEAADITEPARLRYRHLVHAL